MVIQRLQSLWLLVAGILIAVFCVMPMAIIPDNASPDSITTLSPSDNAAFLTVNILIAALLFLAIFLYKNTRRQKTVTLISMLLICVSAATGILLTYNQCGTIEPVEWLGSIILLVGALLFTIMAYRGIRRDERLLRAADRLR